jgi:hypothetical protein
MFEYSAIFVQGYQWLMSRSCVLCAVYRACHKASVTIQLWCFDEYAYISFFTYIIISLLLRPPANTIITILSLLEK